MDGHIVKDLFQTKYLYTRVLNQFAMCGSIKTDWLKITSLVVV